MQKSGRRRARLSKEAWERLLETSVESDRSGPFEIRREITSAIPMPGVDADMQPVYREAHIEQGRRYQRMQAQRAMDREQQKSATSFGMDRRIAVPVMILATAICLIVFMTGRVSVWQTSARIKQLNERIENMNLQCESLQDQYDNALDGAKIATRAVELGMVAASKSTTIKLYAPENALLTPQNVKFDDSME